MAAIKHFLQGKGAEKGLRWAEGVREDGEGREGKRKGMIRKEGEGEGGLEGGEGRREGRKRKRGKGESEESGKWRGE